MSRAPGALERCAAFLREIRPASHRLDVDAAREAGERAALEYSAKRYELALRAGWDGVHSALRITKPFYDRFTPAISAADFSLRAGDLDRALDFLAVCHAE